MSIVSIRDNRPQSIFNLNGPTVSYTKTLKE